MKTFVIGDIHGAYKALVQCLERSGFDYITDRLICLGDIVDGFPEVKQCIDELLSLKNCVCCTGNHDHWAIEYFSQIKLWKDNNAPLPRRAELWAKQGGDATCASYFNGMPDDHLEFLLRAYPYIVYNEYLFIHGGIDGKKSLRKHSLQDLIWDRQMVETAWKKHIRGQQFKFGPYKEIFCGHTSTQCFGIWDGTRIVERRPTVPLHLCNIWMLDTGAGWDGKLTIMDVDSKAYWQSDSVMSLYPGEGRFKALGLVLE